MNYDLFQIITNSALWFAIGSNFTMVFISFRNLKIHEKQIKEHREHIDRTWPQFKDKE